MEASQRPVPECSVVGAVVEQRTAGGQHAGIAIENRHIMLYMTVELYGLSQMFAISQVTFADRLMRRRFGLTHPVANQVMHAVGKTRGVEAPPNRFGSEPACNTTDPQRKATQQRHGLVPRLYVACAGLPPGYSEIRRSRGSGNSFVR